MATTEKMDISISKNVVRANKKSLSKAYPIKNKISVKNIIEKK